MASLPIHLQFFGNAQNLVCNLKILLFNVFFSRESDKKIYPKIELIFPKGINKVTKSKKIQVPCKKTT